MPNTVDFAFNPSKEVISMFCKQSKHNAAKWIKDDSRRIVYWPAFNATHAEMANAVGFDSYEKGIAVPTDKTTEQSDHLG